MIVCGGFFIMCGLGLTWVGMIVARAYRYRLPAAALHRQHVATPPKSWLWLALWSVNGLGWAALDVAEIIDPKGHGESRVVPTSVPVIDHVIRIVSSVCILGGGAALIAAMMVENARRRRSDHQGSADA